MRSLKALSVIAACGFAPNAFAACEQPPLVLIPAQEDIEGNEREIVEATREYFEGMQAYVDCIQQELAAAGEEPPTLVRNVLVQRNNAAVAEAEAVQRVFQSRFPEQATAPIGEEQ
ncbi:MAG: hypothetical protein JXB36_15405 [Gammaproteobacteria bacterium]|nr:hypothetical protein [Gammaproteobacteria bacterium]